MNSALGMAQQQGTSAWYQQQMAALQWQQQQQQQSHVFATKALPTKKEKKVTMVRDYINKHRDVIFTLAVALLVDHFVLNGALRHRIQAVIEAALEKIEKALGLPATKEVTP